jgi:hypothetical protein
LGCVDIYGKRDLRELIALGALDGTVEDEDVAKSLGLEDKYILIEGFFDMKDFVDLEGHGLAWPLVRDLVKPAIYFYIVSFERKSRGTCLRWRDV